MWEAGGELGGVDRGLVGVEDCDYYDASVVQGGQSKCYVFWSQQDCLGFDVGVRGVLLTPGAPQPIRLGTVNKRIQGLLCK